MSITIDRRDHLRYTEGDTPVTAEQFWDLMNGRSVEVDGKTLTLDDGPFYVPDDAITVRGPLRRISIQRGGAGSGHFDHEGRPGEVGGSKPSGEHTTETDTSAGAVAEFGTGTIEERMERLRSLGVRIGSRSVDEILEASYAAYEVDDTLPESYRERNPKISREQYFENWRNRYSHYDPIASDEFQEWVIEGIEAAIADGVADPEELNIIIRRSDPNDPGDMADGKPQGNIIVLHQNDFLDENVEYNRSSHDNHLIQPSDWGNTDARYVSVAQYAFEERYTGIIAHELGHINSSDGWGVEDGTFQRAGQLARTVGEEEIKRWISNYATTNRLELEAEIMALARHPRLDEFPEQTRRFVNFVANGGEL